MLRQQAFGLLAPSGRHWVVTFGDLRGWIVRTFTADVKPGREMTTVICVPTFRAFLLTIGMSDTVPAAGALVKDFFAHAFGHVAVTVEPAGTFLTVKDVSLVRVFVELAKLKARVTRIGAAVFAAPPAASRFDAPAVPPAPAGGGTTVKVRLAGAPSTLPTRSVARTSKV